MRIWAKLEYGLLLGTMIAVEAKLLYSTRYISQLSSKEVVVLLLFEFTRLANKEPK